MTLETLIAEGERLSRPSFLLYPEPKGSGELVGYWGGSRKDIPDELPPYVTAFTGRRHIFTLNEELLARLGINQGPVSLFEWESEEADTSYRVESDPRLRFRDLILNGDPLYATASHSFPPWPAICLYGSDQVGAWLGEQGLARHEYWKVAGELPEQYEEDWRKRAPLLVSEADMVIGGWHMLWPDDDFYTPLELQLVALTLRDAEPWFEIWHSPRSLGWQARRRIT